jgi:hypothetical protein
MTDTTAKIRAKGLDSTGVTEEIASQMYATKGRHYMAIVEVRVEERHEKADGTRKVDLILTQVEPATSEDLAEHLRELTRTLYYNRGLNGHTGTIGGGNDEPTVEGVMNAGARHRPHPFLPVNAGENDQPICDVCGQLETAPVHSTQDALPDGDDEPDDQDDAELEDDEISDEIDAAYDEPDDDEEDLTPTAGNPFTVVPG